MSIYLATFGKLRYLGLANMEDSDEAGNAPRSGRALLQTMRGLEMGIIGGHLSPEQEKEYREACTGNWSGEQTRGPEPMLQEVEFIRYANEEDIKTWRQCGADEEQVLVKSREILACHSLNMKLVDVEYLLDRKKLFFYFTSEQRVDFRAYVRDLAREFKTRIEMRQIGVRDEARVVRGVAPCGQPCCCSYWLHRFSPIGIRMVKEQKLALNPTKISGICGRLMCCMAYEQPVYEDLWKNLPGPGAKIRAEQGIYVLDSVDLATNSAVVLSPSGIILMVPIAEFENFKETVQRGEPWGEEEAAAAQAKTTAAPTSPTAHRKIRTDEKHDEKRAERVTPRAVQEKITLEEHLAKRKSEAFEDRGNAKKKPTGKTRPEGGRHSYPHRSSRRH